MFNNLKLKLKCFMCGDDHKHKKITCNKCKRIVCDKCYGVVFINYTRTCFYCLKK